MEEATNFLKYGYYDGTNKHIAIITNEAPRWAIDQLLKKYDEVHYYEQEGRI